MGQTPFDISLSEAMLLGRCLGLYEEANRNEFRFPLKFIFDKYLKPMLPHIKAMEKLTEVTVPVSVDWHKLPDESSIGYSNATPNFVYWKENESINAMLFVSRKKFLDRLIIEWLIDELPGDYQALLESPEDNARSYFELHKNAGSNPSYFYSTDKLIEENENEEIQDVSKRVLDLINIQNCEDIREAYSIGIALSQIQILVCMALVDIQSYFIVGSPLNFYLGHSEDLDSLIYSIEASQQIEPIFFSQSVSPSDWAKECLVIFNRLSEHESITKSNHSSLWIQNLQAKINLIPVDVDCPVDSSLGQEGFHEYLECIQETRAFTFFLQGELCGRWAGFDNQITEYDKHCLVPRWIRLTPNSSADRVRGSLDDIGTKFKNYSSTEDLSSIVLNLKDGIEALAKRIWDKEFAESPNKSVSDVLHDKIRNEDGMKKKFASLALHMYKIYRNDATHNIDRFTCSTEESVSFYWNMRALLKMYEEIDK